MPHPDFARTMKRLHVELIVSLDRHEAHGRPSHCLGKSPPYRCSRSCWSSRTPLRTVQASAVQN
jgi:hypothetical protein